VHQARRTKPSSTSDYQKTESKRSLHLINHSSRYSDTLTRLFILSETIESCNMATIDTTIQSLYDLNSYEDRWAKRSRRYHRARFAKLATTLGSRIRPRVAGFRPLSLLPIEDECDEGYQSMAATVAIVLSWTILWDLSRPIVALELMVVFITRRKRLSNG